MSAKYRKPSFHTPATADESKILDSLSDETGMFEIPFKMDLYFILNTIVRLQDHQKRVVFLLDEKLHSQLHTWQSQQGLDGLSIDLSRVAEADYVQSALDTATRKKDSQADVIEVDSLQELSDTWDYTKSVLQKKALGDNTLEHTLSNFLSLHRFPSKLPSSLLLPVDQFDFTTKEYWSLRGRVNHARKLFQSGLNERSDLEALHPVFFDMYTPDEAYTVVHELMRNMKEQINNHLIQLESWIDQYALALAKDSEGQVDNLRKKALRIRQQIQDLLDKKSPSEHPTKWTGIFHSRSAHNPQQDEIIRQWQAFKHHWNLYQKKSLSIPEENQPLDAIPKMLDDVFSQLGTLKRRLKKSNDVHLKKLNRHTIRFEKEKSDFVKIQENIRAFMEEVNGFQLFRSHIEDHSLNLHSQLAMLFQLKKMISGIFDQTESLRDFIQWKQYTSTVDDKGLQVIQALTGHPTNEWMHLFDTWYLGHYIQCQDIVHWSDSTLTGKAAIMIEQRGKEAIAKTHSRILAQWMDQNDVFSKKNKPIQKWLRTSSKENSVPMEEVKALMIDHPVLVLAPEQAEVLPSIAADIVISNLPDIPAFTTKSQILTSSEIAFALPRPPMLSSQVLHSPHTDRMPEIKTLAQYILRSLPHFQMWQNQSEVVITQWSQEVNRVLSPLFEMTHQEAKIDTENMDLLLEALVNNNARTYYWLWSIPTDGTTCTMDFTLEVSLKNFLDHCGFEVSMINWGDLLKNKDLYGYLYSQSITSKHHVKKASLAR